MKSSRSDKLSVAATSKKKLKGPKTLESQDVDIKKNCTFVLSLLDGMKDALCYRGGSSGDIPYFVRSAVLDRLIESSKLSGLLRIQNVSLNSCTDRGFKKFIEGLKKRSDPRYSPSAEYLKLDYQSGASAIYFFIAILELYFDSLPKIVEVMEATTIIEPFLWLAGLDSHLFVGYAKYITAYPMAAFLQQQDLPVPPSGFPETRRFLFLGAMKRLIRNRVYSFTKKNACIFQGLLQGVKRAALEVPTSFIASAIEKHASILSKPSGFESMNVQTSWSKVEEEIDFETNFRRKLRSIINGRFKEGKMIAQFNISDDEIRAVKVPSSSAAYERAAHRGGQFREVQTEFVSGTEEAYQQRMNMDRTSLDQEIKELKKEAKETGVSFESLYSEWVALGGLFPTNEPGFFVAPSNLLSMYSDVRSTTEFRGYALPTPAIEGYSLMDQLLSDVIDLYFETDELESDILPGTTYLVRIRRRQVTLDYVYARAPEGSEEFKESPFLTMPILAQVLPSCNVIPLSEPLKVRTITTGPALLYYLSKPLQIKFWEHLQQFPQFILTGEPLQEHHLHDIIAQEKLLEQKLKFDLQFDQWVSGDYSAATDNLDIHYTLLCFDGFAATAKTRLSEEYFRATRIALEPHELCYNSNESPNLMDFLIEKKIPFRRKPGVYDIVIDQKNGQLMGSPLSFPFLCIINLIVYWISLEEYTKLSIKVHSLPVRVNGDDILFRSNNKFYAIWKQNVARVSFLLSMGKNYIHRNILTVNSVMYYFKFNGVKPGEPMGSGHTFEEITYLNIGLLTAQSKSTMRDVHRNLPLSEVYRIVVGGAMDRPRAHDRFLHYNKAAISRMTDSGKYNLFVPVHLGGLGFPIFPEVYSSNRIVTKKIFDPLVSMLEPARIETEQVPYITANTFQQRFATFLLSKQLEKMENGDFPKEYFSALVNDNGKEEINQHTVHHGFYRLEFAPYGPLREDQKEHKPNSITQHPLTALNLKAGYEADLQYRLPSSRLLREFNAFNKHNLGIASSKIRERMSIDQLLFAEPLRVVEQIDLYEDYDTDDSFDAFMLENAHYRL